MKQETLTQAMTNLLEAWDYFIGMVFDRLFKMHSWKWSLREAQEWRKNYQLSLNDDLDIPPFAVCKYCGKLYKDIKK